MSQNSQTNDAHDDDSLADRLRLPKNLWCRKVIAERRLEEKTEAAVDRFWELLNRQPIDVKTKEKLANLALKAIECRFEIENALWVHIQMCIGDSNMLDEMAHHYEAEYANTFNDLARTRRKLRRFRAGRDAVNNRVTRRRVAMDEGWKAGYQTKTALLDFMKQQEAYSGLIRTRNKAMNEEHVWADFLKYKRQKEQQSP